jgi:hypothetical protein
MNWSHEIALGKSADFIAARWDAIGTSRHFAVVLMFVRYVVTFIITSKRRVDAVNQIIVAKWFWQVANDSETEGLGSNIFVRLSGNQNGGNAAAKRLEASM